MGMDGRVYRDLARKDEKNKALPPLPPLPELLRPLPLLPEPESLPGVLRVEKMRLARVQAEAERRGHEDVGNCGKHANAHIMGQAQ